MATGNKTYVPVTPKLMTSFVVPDGYLATGIAPVCENKAWILVFNWPMVILIDTTGHVHQTGYTVAEMRKIREETTTDNMLKAARAKGMDSRRIATGGSDSCFVLTSEQSMSSIKHINKSGAVSRVISGLGTLDIFGIAYLPESSDKGRVLFGDNFKGICSVKWPRNWLLGLFTSPSADIFCPENEGYLSIAVHQKSDLVCAMTLRNKIFIINRNGQKVSEYSPTDAETIVNQSITFDHTGCVIVHTLANSSVRRISPDGQVIQTIFPEISEDATVCDDCKILDTPPKCRECKNGNGYSESRAVCKHLSVVTRRISQLVTIVT